MTRQIVLPIATVAAWLFSIAAAAVYLGPWAAAAVWLGIPALWLLSLFLIDRLERREAAARRRHPAGSAFDGRRFTADDDGPPSWHEPGFDAVDRRWNDGG